MTLLASTLSNRVTVTCVVVVPRWARLSLSPSCSRGAALGPAAGAERRVLAAYDTRDRMVRCALLPDE